MWQAQVNKIKEYIKENEKEIIATWERFVNTYSGTIEPDKVNEFTGLLRCERACPPPSRKSPRRPRRKRPIPSPPGRGTARERRRRPPRLRSSLKRPGSGGENAPAPAQRR